MKRPIFKNFLKLIIRINRKLTYEDLTFLLGKLYQKFFLFYTLFTHGILDAEFGYTWTTLRPNQKDLFLNYLFELIANFRTKN